MEKLILLFSIMLFCINRTYAQTVSSLSRTKSTVAGLLDMRVTGSGFTSGSSPKAVITMTYLNADTTFEGSTCSVTTSTEMLCQLPAVVLPNGFTPPDISIGQNPLINNADITFKVGVTFNNNNNFAEFQNLNLYSNPDLSGNDINRQFNVWTNRIIVIIGKQLSAAASRSDYSVSLNDQQCEVQFLNISYLSCQLPLDVPTPNDGDYTRIVVHLGAYSRDVGRVWYRVPVFEIADPLPVIEYTQNDVITLDGTGLLAGLVATDYDVKIGQTTVNDLRVTDTSLFFRGPSSSPTPTGLYPQHPNNYPQLSIIVPKSNSDAFRYTYHVAYVRYLDHDYSQDQPVAVGPDNPFGVGTGTNGNGNNAGDNTENGSNDDSNNDDNSNEKKNKNGLSEAGKWAIIGMSIALSLLFLLALLCLFCVYGQRNRYRREHPEKSGRYLDTVSVLPSSSRSHGSRPSYGSSQYPTSSELYRMYNRGY